MDAMSRLVVASESGDFLKLCPSYRSARPNVTSPQRVAHYLFVKQKGAGAMTGSKVCWPPRRRAPGHYLGRPNL